MAMVRKQMYLTQELDEKVKRLAREWDVPEAEVVRTALVNLREYRPPGSGGHPAVRETATLPYGAAAMETIKSDIGKSDIGRGARRELTRDSWERFLQLVEERSRTVEKSEGGRTWTREDLYDERLDRFSR